MNVGYYTSPVGLLIIKEQDGKIIELGTVEDKEFPEVVSDTLENAKRQLDEYFNGRRKEFSLDLEMVGTPYMLKIWQELLKIPYGETITYKELAKRVGNIKGSRSAGGACGKNNIMIVVPCHRVIGSNGKLTGYAGGLDIKSKLLEIEYQYSSFME